MKHALKMHPECLFLGGGGGSLQWIHLMENLRRIVLFALFDL